MKDNKREAAVLGGWEGSSDQAQQRSAGGVIYRPYKVEGQDQTRYLVALIARSHTGWWDLPKGHLELNETDVEAAVREVAEETGIHGEVVTELGESRYYVSELKRGQGQIRKAVRWFLMRDISEQMTVPVPQPGETQEAIWCDLDNAIPLVYFDNTRVILRRARRYLQDLQGLQD